MKKLLILIIGLIFLVGAVSVFMLNRDRKSTDKEEYSMSDLIDKKIAIIIAFKNFRDEEYFIPRKILEEAGAKIEVVSNEVGTAFGVEGLQVNTNTKLSDLDISNFDAVVFVGGPGALDNLNNQDSYRVIREAVKQNKVLAAICISPVILAEAGVLNGKKATVWTNPLNKEPKKILEENGAIFTEQNVVVDGNIITANGPDAAAEFGKKLVEILVSK